MLLLIPVVLMLYVIIYSVLLIFSVYWLILPMACATAVIIVALGLCFFLSDHRTVRAGKESSEREKSVKYEHRHDIAYIYALLAVTVIAVVIIFSATYYFHYKTINLGLSYEHVDAALEQEMDQASAAQEHKMHRLSEVRDQLMDAMVNIRMYRSIDQLYCKNEKYMGSPQGKLFMSGIQLNSAVFWFSHAFPADNVIKEKIKQFVALSNVDKVCQKGSATDKELGPLQDQISALILESIKASSKQDVSNVH